MIEFLQEFWEFLRERKKYCLLPIIIVLALFGILIDNGFSIENIAFISGIYILISLSLLMIIRSTLEPIKIKK